MANHTLIPQPLTKEAFATYGDVIEASDESQHFTINHGCTERYHDLARIDVDQQEGKALVSIFRSTPKTQPISIELMECHPLSSQAFMPLSNNPYLVVVAPAGKFNQNAIVAFIAQHDQGVNYHAGTWHHFSLALNAKSDFLVIDRGGKGDNCNEIRLEHPIQIVLSEKIS